MMNLKVKLQVVLMLSVFCVFGQNSASINSFSTQEESQINYKHSLGTSFFMLGNFLSNSPDYYLLTYGYQFAKKDKFFIEFNTWKYSEPLGSYGNSKELYPGYVRATGLGVGYQRFHWKGLLLPFK